MRAPTGASPRFTLVKEARQTWVRRGRVDRHVRSSHHSNVRANVRMASLRRPRLTAGADLCNVPCFKAGLVARLRAGLPPDDALEDARTRFAALSDRTRLKVLHSLLDGEELCVCDVAHVVGMSVSAASHHLRKLRDLKILRYRNDGKMAYYSLRDPLVGRLLRQALRETGSAMRRQAGAIKP